MRILELSAGETATVRVAPGLGGAIIAFTWQGHPVLRPTPAAALAEGNGNVRLASCYPLVPYSNRIREARLCFAGRHYALERNFGRHPHAIHGVGWQRAWRVEEALSHRVRLALTHGGSAADQAAWPWPFHAWQTFELVECPAGAADAVRVTRLSVTLTLRNDSHAPFPFGLGFHPFFPLHPAVELAFDADGVFENDETELPRRRIDIPPAWRFDRARPAAGLALDNVFTGWRGSAMLADAAAGMRTTLAADRACRYLVVYAPRDAGYIALEPVTHETDAFNRHARHVAGPGFRTLPPGAEFSCTMRIAVSAPDRAGSPAHPSS